MGKLKQLIDKKKAEKEQTQKVMVLREFIKKSFYPFLKDQSTSISDADLLLQQIALSIRTAFNNQMLKQTIGELDLSELKEEKYIKLFEMMSKMTITDATMVIDGMNQAIGSCIKKEQRDRKLVELKELEKDFE